MRLVVDTGVFSAALRDHRHAATEALVVKLRGAQLFLAAQTVVELRYGAHVGGWGHRRKAMLEAVIASTTVVAVDDDLISKAARLRFEAREAGHPLAQPIHNGDLWIAASAVHIGAALITADRVFDGAPSLSVA